MSKEQLNININRDEPTLNDFLYCWSLFGTRPNKIILYNTYATSDFNEIISKFTVSKNSLTEIIPDGEDYLINEKVFLKISDEIYISFVIIDSRSDKSIVNELCFIYKTDDNIEKVQEIIDNLNNCIVDFCEEQGNKLNTISITQNGLEVDPISTMEVDVDNVEMFYNSKTYKKYKKTLKAIKKSKKGLSVFYGPRGTGKTSIINHLVSSVDRITIFIPNNMIDSTINNPEFKRFIRRYQNPILIIDDCEMMFSETYNRSNILVNNLLQLIDGFLSDSIQANVITIFNVDDVDEIDHSLLDCNNLIDVVEFKSLTSDESNELGKFLGNSKKFTSDRKLVDVVKNRQEKENFEIGL